MAGRESKRNSEGQEQTGRGSSGRANYRIFALVKLFLGVLLLPLCAGASVSFVRLFGSLRTEINYFISGIVAFLMLYLLVWEPSVLYSRGQKITGAVFRFFLPLLRVASYVLPAYVIILFAVYFVCGLFNLQDKILNSVVFLIGFSQMLHFVFTARTLRERQDFLKANYIFGFLLIYVLNIFILGFGFSLMFSEFSFLNFIRNTLNMTAEIYRPLISQLFLI